MKPTYPRILPDRDRYRRFYLDEQTEVTLHNDDIIVIPKGYRFDGHSVPIIFRLLFKKYGKDIYAAMVHDFLIDMESLFRYNRKFQDAEYKRFMNMPEYRESWYRSKFMPLAVRFYGFIRFDIWGDNRGEY